MPFMVKKGPFNALRMDCFPVVPRTAQRAGWWVGVLLVYTDRTILSVCCLYQLSAIGFQNKKLQAEIIEWYWSAQPHKKDQFEVALVLLIVCIYGVKCSESMHFSLGYLSPDSHQTDSETNCTTIPSLITKLGCFVVLNLQDTYIYQWS